MTRKQADAAFDSLRRHASAITAPAGPVEALKLLDRAVLTPLQRDAMVHYISVGPDNLALAYSIVKAGAATFAAAHLDTLGTGDERDRFAARMIALDVALDGAEPADRATRLLDAFTGHVTAGRDRLSADHDLPGDTDRAGGEAGEHVGERAGDLLEAAGIAYLIGQLLESPPSPAATRR